MSHQAGLAKLVTDLVDYRDGFKREFVSVASFLRFFGHCHSSQEQQQEWRGVKEF
jgi:hypothetical protein